MNESHVARIGLDASAAKRGADQYVGAVNKIISSTKRLNSELSQISSNSSTSSTFTKLARDLAKLNAVRLSPALARNLHELSSAMRMLKAPNANAIRGIQNLYRTLGRSTGFNKTTANNIMLLSQAMNGLKGGGAGLKSIETFLKTLSSVRINNNIATQIKQIGMALRGMGNLSATTAGIRQLNAALQAIRVPRSLSQTATMLNRLGSSVRTNSARVASFGGTLRNVPWASTSAGAVRLTGSLRGLENAFSATYQLGSQFRVLMGSLTLAGATSGIYDATLSLEKFKTIIGVTVKSATEIDDVINHLRNTSYAFGIDLKTVYTEFGKFATAAQITGATMKEVQYIFDGISGAARVAGSSIQDQQLIYLALTQMFSKGRVASEEIRRQLGERLPAAFQLMQEAVREATGDAKASLDDLLKEGKVAPGAVLLMIEKLNEAFGSQFVQASQRADAAIGRMKNAFFEFQAAIGQAGVFDAIGQAADQLAGVIFTFDEAAGKMVMKDEFKKLAQDIGEGLANAIRAAANAAQWLIENIRLIGKALLGLAAAKAFTTASSLAGGLLNAAGAAGLAGSAIGKLAARGGALGGLARAVAGLGGAFTLLGAGAAAALALSWNEVVKLGDSTATVGEIAQAAFSMFIQWAGGVGQSVVQLTTNVLTSFAHMFEGINLGFVQTAKDGNDSWGFISRGASILAKTTVRVLGGAFMTLVSIAKNVGEMVGDILVAMIAGATAAWRAITGDFAGAGDAGKIMADSINRANPTNVLKDIATDAAVAWSDMFEGFGDDVDEFKNGSEQSFADLSAALNARIEEMRKAAAEGNTDLVKQFDFADLIEKLSTTRPESTLPTITTGEDTSNKLDSVAKRAKDAAEAVTNYKAEIAALSAELRAGKITLDQYNQALTFQNQKLEEVVDPYAALIRNMQEENNLLRLSSKEQDRARTFRELNNKLLEEGVVMTDKQTAALKNLIAEQQKLKDPGPLQSWIDGMKDFGDAVEEAGVRAMEGLSDAIADLVVDGKADFASLAKSILKDLIKIGLNQVWKQLFDTKRGTQLEVNTAMTGDAGKQLGLTTSNPSIMAQAVAQGVSIALSGGAGDKLFSDTFGAAASGGVGTANDALLKMGLMPSSSNDLVSSTFSSLQNAPAGTANDALAALGLTGGTSMSPSAASPYVNTSSDATTSALSAINSSFGAGGGFDFSFLSGATDNKDWINRFYAMARGNGMNDTQARLMASQAAWESGYGKSAPGNNFFGIKAGKSWQGDTQSLMTSEWINGQKVRLPQTFRKYGDFQSAMNDRVSFMNSRFSDAQNAGSWQDAVNGLGNGKYGAYATDPSYFTGINQMNSYIDPNMYASGYGGTPGPMMGAPYPAMRPAGGFGLPGGMSTASQGSPFSSFQTLSSGATGGQSTIDMSSLGDQFKSAMQPAFTETANKFPDAMDPAFTKTAQVLPQKFTENNNFSDQLSSAMQPAQQQSAQDFAQNYMNANSQVAQDFSMKMSQSGGGSFQGLGGGGGGGGGLGGLGSLFGMFTSFFEKGGVVGGSAGHHGFVHASVWRGAPSMKMGGIPGDPKARPIIAHEGELVTPEKDVRRMRRLGRHAAMVNPAVDNFKKQTAANDSEIAALRERMANGTQSGGGPSHVTNNWNIVTPDANSFQQSRQQIEQKQAQAQYRSSARNN